MQEQAVSLMGNRRRRIIRNDLSLIIILPIFTRIITTD
jgi:hypothetical protein